MVQTIVDANRTRKGFIADELALSFRMFRLR